MLGVLERFEQNNESLRHATGTLGLLADALEEKDDAWQRSFGSFWNRMEDEDVQAIAHGVVTEAALLRAHEAAAKLKELVLLFGTHSHAQSGTITTMTNSRPNLIHSQRIAILTLVSKTRFSTPM